MLDFPARQAEISKDRPYNNLACTFAPQCGCGRDIVTQLYQWQPRPDTAAIGESTDYLSKGTAH
jgi:hypothetical protein